VAEVFLHDVRHGHAERRSKVLRRHFLLFVRVLQKPEKAIREVLRVPRLIELNGQFFSFGHLAEVGQVGTNDGHSVGARQVRDSAAAGG